MKKVLTLLLVSSMLICSLTACNKRVTDTTETSGAETTTTTTVEATTGVIAETTSTDKATETDPIINTPVSQESTTVMPTTTPTSTTPAPVPAALPTAEELINGITETENVKASMDITMMVTAYDGDMAQNSSIRMLGTETLFNGSSHTVGTTEMADASGSNSFRYVIKEESYTVIEGENQTTYTYDSENNIWYYYTTGVYEDTTESNFSANLKEMKTTGQVTSDNDFYYVQGYVSHYDAGEMSEDTLFEVVDGVTIYQTLKFNKQTKEFISATMKITTRPYSEAGLMDIVISDFTITIEINTDPIIVPTDVIRNANEVIDDYVPVGSEEETTTPSESETTGRETENTVKNPWDQWYADYNSKTGIFIFWSEKLGMEVPFTVNGKEGWYFNNKYEYWTDVAIDDPNFETDGEPAHEIRYEISDCKVNTENNERTIAYLLMTDYTETKTSKDIQAFTCLNKTGYYLVDDSYKYTRYITVLQDIGTTNYAQIEIETADKTSDPLAIIEQYLFNIDLQGQY